MTKEIVSVAQNNAGDWMVTVDGVFLGDSDSKETREEAITYARKIAAEWDVEFDFSA